MSCWPILSVLSPLALSPTTLPDTPREAVTTAAQAAFQIVELFILAIPIACVAWTVTHEEVFREPREFCQRKCQECRNLVQRKFFYLFTCEYCFSHYITAIFLFITRFKLLHTDWRGYLISFFALVWVSNIYMNLFSRVRVELRTQRTEIQAKEKEIQKIDKALADGKPAAQHQAAPGDGEKASPIRTR